MTRLRIKQALALSAGIWIMTGPAFAQVAGSVDTGTQLHNLLAWGLPLAGGAISGIMIFRGVQAASNGHHIGPALAGGAAGLGIAVGGPYIVAHITGLMPN